MIKKLTQTCFFALISIALIPSTEQTAFGQVEKINAANENLLAGKVDEAIDIYESIPPIAGGNQYTLAYNRGVALYRQGKMELAKNSFVESLASDDPEIAGKAAYNVGNCLFAGGLQQSETQKDRAIESLKSAISFYRDALSIDENATDARANIELAYQLQRKLKQEQQQEH